MHALTGLEKFVITKVFPDPEPARTSNDDWERVWRLSPAEVLRYAESARVVCGELGLRPLGSAQLARLTRN
jgi:hypothetical protein